MSKESIFQKYYKKLAGEGLLKSFLLALTIALFVETVILLAFWFVGIKRYWLSAGISVGVFAALVPSLYFLFGLLGTGRTFAHNERIAKRRIVHCNAPT